MVVDASAILSIVLDEDDQRTMAQAMHENRISLLLSPIGAWEVATRIQRMEKPEEKRIATNRYNATLAAFEFRIVAIDGTQTDIAIGAQAKYGKRNHPAGLNVGDCFAYALAKTRNEPLLFKGDDFRHTDVRAAL